MFSQAFIFASVSQEDCLEKVISDTECLFKSREKEYQETIDQIEVRYVTNMWKSFAVLRLLMINGNKLSSFI